MQKTIVKLSHETLLKFIGVICTVGVLITGYELWWFGSEHPLGPDAGYYLMRTLKVRDGEVPFRDFFTMHPPGSFYLQDLFLSLFGNSPEGLFLTMYAHLIAVGVLVLFIQIELFGFSLTWVGPSLLLYLYLVPVYETFYFVIEPMVSFWGLAAIYFSLLAVRPRSSESKVLPAMLASAAGLLLGVAFSIKQTSVAYAAVPCILLFLRYRSQRSEGLQTVLWLLLGTIVPAVIFFSFYPDTLRPWFEQNVLTLIRYAQGNVAQDTHSPAATLICNYLIFAIPFATLLLTIPKTVRQDAALRSGYPQQLAIAVCAIVLALPCFLRPYLHYYLSPLPLVSILAGGLISHCERKAARLAIAVCGLLFLATVTSGVRQMHALLYSLRRHGELGYETQRAQVEWIEQLAGPVEKALILPDSPQYFYLTGYKCPIGDYVFWIDERYREAALNGYPLFFVDRGTQVGNDTRRQLIEWGFEPRDKFGQVERWTKK